MDEKVPHLSLRMAQAWHPQFGDATESSCPLSMPIDLGKTPRLLRDNDDNVANHDHDWGWFDTHQSMRDLENGHPLGQILQLSAPHPHGSCPPRCLALSAAAAQPPDATRVVENVSACSWEGWPQSHWQLQIVAQYMYIYIYISVCVCR